MCIRDRGYSNDLTLFGRRRGSGETIWDIKKHIGYVSSSLHLDYRVSTTVRNVCLLYTSINLWTDDKDNLWTNIVERQRHALQEIG